LLDRLPFSYNHLLFNPTLVRFPAGLGDPGSNRFADVLCPNGLDPNDDRLSPMLFCMSGLPIGEGTALPRPDSGELA
jgi:hypothetical protein